MQLKPQDTQSSIKIILAVFARQETAEQNDKMLGGSLMELNKS